MTLNFLSISLVLLSFCVGLVSGLVVLKRRNRKSENDEPRIQAADQPMPQTAASNSPQPQEENAGTDTREMVFNLLVQMGCQPIKNGERDLVVSYQGEEFYLQFNGNFIRFWDANWTYIDANSPEVSFILELFNEVNYNNRAKLFLDNPNQEGRRYFLSQYELHLPPSTENKIELLKASFAEFFNIKNSLRFAYEQATKETAKQNTEQNYN